ncbi:kinase-like domain-containing protein [Scleroderma yunnanense]
MLSMTVDLHCGGMLAWMAPEILHGSEVSVASDIWAFGMTALELFARSRPFYDLPNAASVMYRILRGPPDRPTGESTFFHLTDAWWDICSSCWESDPLLRPEMLEITQKLNEVMSPSAERSLPQHQPPNLSQTVIKKKYVCRTCDRDFCTSRLLACRDASNHSDNKYPVPDCDKRYSRISSLQQRHHYSLRNVSGASKQFQLQQARNYSQRGQRKEPQSKST